MAKSKRRKITDEERTARALESAIARIGFARAMIEGVRSHVGNVIVDKPLTEAEVQPLRDQLNVMVTDIDKIRIKLAGWRNKADGYTEDGG